MQCGKCNHAKKQVFSIIDVVNLLKLHSKPWTDSSQETAFYQDRFPNPICLVIFQNTKARRNLAIQKSKTFLNAF